MLIEIFLPLRAFKQNELIPEILSKSTLSHGADVPVGGSYVRHLTSAGDILWKRTNS
jgi:hypothetical protein